VSRLARVVRKVWVKGRGGARRVWVEERRDEGDPHPGARPPGLWIIRGER
jgi:hypothetical protein